MPPASRHDLRGLLADISAQGELFYLVRLLKAMNLYEVFESLGLSFSTFVEIGIPQNIDDRSLWHVCQSEGWVLLTDNRNKDDANSLGTTLADSWQAGQLPVLTISSKPRFQEDDDYAQDVAKEIAEIVFGVEQAEYCDRPRIFVPR